jgi:hypothetical protein
MKKIALCKILITALILITNGISSQNFSIKKMPLSVAYYGENGFHPGIKVGTFYTLMSKEKSKTYRRKSKQTKYGTKLILKELVVDYNLGFYSHPNNHTGLFTNLGLTWLRTKLRKSRQIGVCFEVGYLRRYNKFKTYQLTSDDKIEQVKFAGNNALIISLAPLFGKEIKKSERRMRVYVKPLLQFLQYTYTWQANASLELGLVLNIKREKKKDEINYHTTYCRYCLTAIGLH